MRGITTEHGILAIVSLVAVVGLIVMFVGGTGGLSGNQVADHIQIGLVCKTSAIGIPLALTIDGQSLSGNNCITSGTTTPEECIRTLSGKIARCT